MPRFKYNESKFDRIRSDAEQARAAYLSLSDRHMELKRQLDKAVTTIDATVEEVQEIRGAGGTGSYKRSVQRHMPRNEVYDALRAHGHAALVDEYLRIGKEMQRAAETQRRTKALLDRCEQYLQDRGVLPKGLNYEITA